MKALKQTVTAISLLSVVFFALLFSGCSGEEEQAVGTVALNIQGTGKGALAAAVPSKVGALAAATVDLKDGSGAVVGSLTITEARVSLKEIEFDVDDDTDFIGDDPTAVDSIEFEGPFVVDLLTNTTTPSLGTATLPAGVYKEIELKIDKIQGDEVDGQGQALVDPSDPLFGNSIYIEGTYTGPSASGAQTDIPFSMSFDLDEEFELTGAGDTSNGVNLDAAVQNSVIIAFRMQKWFAFDNGETNPNGLAPAQLVVSAGRIDLSADSTGVNKEIRDVIKDNIKESADYGEDSDDDGELSDSEDDDPDAEDGDDD